MKRIARLANAHLPPDQHLIASLHVIRHTLLRKVVHEKGVHYAMELSGHRSDRYIWRYVRPDAQSLADAMNDLQQSNTVNPVFRPSWYKGRKSLKEGSGYADDHEQDHRAHRGMAYLWSCAGCALARIEKNVNFSDPTAIALLVKHHQ